MKGRDSDVSLRATHTPEFDAWRWSEYWVPLDAVIDFKRDVYTKALNDLAIVVFKRGHETRYLRQRVQTARALKAPEQKTHARTAG
jgi:putative (di)nucleoside polyphosphate hydrolase